MLPALAGWGLGLLSAALWQAQRDRPPSPAPQLPPGSPRCATDGECCEAVACADSDSVSPQAREPSGSPNPWQVVARRSSSTTESSSPQKRLVRAISLHLSPQKSRLQPLLSGAIELEDLADPGFADANEALLDDVVQSIGRWDVVVPIQRLGSGASGCAKAGLESYIARLYVLMATGWVTGLVRSHQTSITHAGRRSIPPFHNARPQVRVQGQLEGRARGRQVHPLPRRGRKRAARRCA